MKKENNACRNDIAVSLIKGRTRFPQNGPYDECKKVYKIVRDAKRGGAIKRGEWEILKR